MHKRKVHLCLLVAGALLLGFILALSIRPIPGSASPPPTPQLPPHPPRPPDDVSALQPAQTTEKVISQDLPSLRAVLLVGPIDGDDGSWTTSEKQNMDLAATELASHGVTVFKFYTPDNDWEQIKDAANGAHFVFYRGHGVYSGDMPPTWVGGFSLKDRFASSDDIRNDLNLAPNAIVMLYGWFTAGSSSAPDEGDADAWRAQWRRAFTVEHRYTITKSQELAREMARHAVTVRDLVNEVYGLETDEGPLRQLYSSFKEMLLHDLTPDAFADMVAQTVAYGLFSAATQSDELTYDRMVELIPGTNPFLKDLLAELMVTGAEKPGFFRKTRFLVDLDELGVGQLVEMLRQTDVEAILHDFGRQTGGGREDPVVHFYELFLGEYDKEKKVQRGVFYTPDPVVSYIVRSVDTLLKTEFGLADGLADTGVDPETGEPLVQILDPATGTGTFLTHIIDQIESTVKARPGADWNAYVADHLLPCLNGFELMMAPYAVAHMKLGLRLHQTGYDFASGERLRVYLTNTLEEPVEMHERLALAGFLSKESNAAARVKRQTPITVVIGNPPYAGHSANESEWIAGLLRGTDGDGRRLENYFEVDGHGLNERNPKWLNDDYVKFIRFGQWRIEHAGAGILAFITNHGYLDNPTFRGMRQSLMAAFDAIYVLDLHGSLKKEMAPDGGPDENVFDIQPGVAILLAVKRPAQTSKVSETLEVYHADLWGLRGQKYAQLLKTDVGSTGWETLSPRSPFYLLVPQDVAVRAEYMQGWKITEAMPTNVLGFQTHRDRFAVAFDKEEIRQRIELMRRKKLTDAQFREQFRVRDNRDWQLAKARRQLRADKHWQKAIMLCLYRPFDLRWCYFSTVTSHIQSTDV